MPDSKIYVKKEDDLAQVMEQILGMETDPVILNIPKFSRLAKSELNFSLLKKEVSGLGRNLVIESVDDEVITLAQKHRISASNPFFEHQSEPAVVLKPTAVKAANPEQDLLAEWEKTPIRRSYLRPLLALATLIFLIWPAFWAVSGVLTRAEVKIVTLKTPWSFDGSLVLPVQVFTEKRNAEFSFPATGRQAASKKARGEIVIYNNFSPSPQPLVATTRFLAPDGKIFRLVKAVTVPGAPGSIKAEVAADKPGPEYNVGPIAKLTIPGFQGSPKHNSFYGEIKENIGGGFIGETSLATKEDIAKAKSAARENLTANLVATLVSQLPAGYKIIESPTTTQFAFLKEEFKSEVNDKGEFNLFAEGEIKAVAFSEEALLADFKQKIRQEKSQDFNFKSRQLQYNVNRVDWNKGELELAVNFQAALEAPIAEAELKKKLAGKSEGELKALILTMPGLEGLTASIKPFWRRTLPRAEKIEILLD